MLRRMQPDYRPPFELIDFMTVVEHREGRGILAEATVKVRVGGEIMHTAAEGNGPVNAMDQALRKALVPHFPHLAEIQLVDYKVRILDGDAATAAITRVIIETRNGHTSWSTVGHVREHHRIVVAGAGGQYGVCAADYVIRDACYVMHEALTWHVDYHVARIAQQMV